MTTQVLKSDAYTFIWEDPSEGPNPAWSCHCVWGRQPQSLYHTHGSFLCCLLEFVFLCLQRSLWESAITCKINFERLNLLPRTVEIGRSLFFSSCGVLGTICNGWAFHLKRAVTFFLSASSALLHPGVQTRRSLALGFHTLQAHLMRRPNRQWKEGSQSPALSAGSRPGYRRYSTWPSLSGCFIPPGARRKEIPCRCILTSWNLPCSCTWPG